MTSPFMRAYALELLKTCHKRNAPAIGGMSALIPIKNDPAANDRAMAGVRSDKARDATDSYDGGWVAHPGLVPVAMEEFVKVLGDKPNQIGKQRTDVQVTGHDLLDFRPKSRSPRRACATTSTSAFTISDRGLRAMAACQSTT